MKSEYPGPMDFFSMGLAFIGIGIAFLAINLSQKTDEIVKSLSNLNFDEKVAIIKSEIDAPRFERIKWDLLAISHIQEWASAEQKCNLQKTVDKYLERLSMDPENKQVVEEIKEIMKKIKV